MEDTEDVIPTPTSHLAATIKPIGKDTVHRICSGQVVLSLAVAVKELVENGIDAGATLIEVRLREQGLKSLEVSDNGSGVEEHNITGMTAKYHTSKIREFVDLLGVETFGFRGEALSSLCALADMAIVTRHKSSDVGLRVELDHNGSIQKRVPTARSVGTTVTLTNLFATLPVRQRDFSRNIKKEFTKMCQILQAYCLASKNVRIICTNQGAKGDKTVVVQTHGSADVMANIVAVFGSRQADELMPLKTPLDSDQPANADAFLRELCSEMADSINVSSEDIACMKANQFNFEGYVSSCAHGSGRSSKDRQYFYVNARPCDSKNLAKVVNEVYHRYNVHQFPFVYLNIQTPRNEVDVNLTPDKRQLLINNEKILLLLIKKSLLNTYGNVPSTFKMQNTTIVSMLDSSKQTMKETETTMSDKIEEEVADGIVPISTTQRFLDVLAQWKSTGDTVGTAPPRVTAKRKQIEEIDVRTLKMKKIQDFLTQEESNSENNKESNCSNKSESETEDDIANLSQTAVKVENLKTESSEFDALIQSNDDMLVEQIDCKVKTKPRLRFVESKPIMDEDDELHYSNTRSVIQPVQRKIIELDWSDGNDDNTSSLYASAQLSTTIAEIELSLQAEENFLMEEQKKTKLDRLRFKSEISPSQNQKAEAELQREISKTSFEHMDIIGQFNLGFIIVKLDSDLFIVDQHATDEKYNFETLQRTTVLQNQKLACPQVLEMTAVNEMVLLDNLEVFEKNGFKFEIDQNAPPTKKVRLLCKPFSKNWEFGKEDIDELIFMLQDAPTGTICRPSRIRAMFASRACRQSVMIGQALNMSSMKRLIVHMGEIEQPWNCPHGRPTIRHLINTAMLADDEER